MDPDEYLEAHGRDSFSSLLTKTKPLIDILWQKYTDGVDFSTPERKALIEKTLIGEVNRIGDVVVRNYYMQEIKSRIYQTFRPKTQRVIEKEEGRKDNRVVEAGTIKRDDRKEGGSFKKERADNRYYNKVRGREEIGHQIVSNPSELKKSIDNETDKNLRFIIASELIYPELIDDYEEHIFIDEIKDEGLKALQILLGDVYHESEVPLNGEEICCEIKNRGNKEIDKLWEYQMLKERKPFINELRKNIDRLLLENRIRSIEAELKEIVELLKKDFNEEAYLRQKALQEERSEILLRASEPE